MKRAVAVGSRTYLRRPVLGDHEEFLTNVRRSRNLHRPFVHPADDEPAFRAWLARGQRPDTELFLVCRRDDDAIAGFANLNTIITGNLQQCFLGYAAFVPHAGQGHLTEGVDLALRVAFTVLRLHRVEANIQPENQRSRALAVRLGFRLEGYSPRYLRVGGRWCDHERWAILADEWRARHPSTPAVADGPSADDHQIDPPAPEND